jgi:pyrimidine operon attenuation protein/uracil phosphoribosyltransferase
LGVYRFLSNDELVAIEQLSFIHYKLNLIFLPAPAYMTGFSDYICFIKPPMHPRVILESKKLDLTITRLCHQLIEQHKDFAEAAIIGVQPRGVFLANRIYEKLTQILKRPEILYGKLDITFYRDDFRLKSKPMIADETDIKFSVEGRNIVLIDDVLYTGRTIRSALDAILDYGRPADVELLVLIDRRLHRHLPIQAKYVGKVIDSIASEKVVVEWKETDSSDKVWITSDES